MLFDSHCHLTDERLAAEVDDVVARAREASVERLVTVASDPEDAEQACRLAGRFPGLWATAGVHPHCADRADAGAFARIRELIERPEIVALGETGLDYHYDNAPRDVQRRAVGRHLELAAEVDLPLVVHSRSADADTVAVIREAAGSVRGVLHCFAGGPALFEAALDAGWYISFSGLVTFPGFDVAELAAAVPSDRLLIETDSPYLAPVPKRGRRNEPAFVEYVADAVARLRGESAESVAQATTRNACAFYRLED